MIPDNAQYNIHISAYKSNKSAYYRTKLIKIALPNDRVLYLAETNGHIQKQSKKYFCTYFSRGEYRVILNKMVKQLPDNFERFKRGL